MNRIPVTEASAEALDIFTHRKDVQLRMYYEPQEGLFLAESAMVIERALDAGYIPESVLADEAFLHSDAAAVLDRCGGIPVYTTPAGELKQITGYNVTRGVLCAMRRRPLPDPGEICRGAKRAAVLENVMNPTNVGAIFRSAAAMGIDAVLLTPDCGDPAWLQDALDHAEGIPNLWKPARADYHRVDAIPLLGTGKIDLGAVKRLARSFYRG